MDGIHIAPITLIVITIYAESIHLQANLARTGLNMKWQKGVARCLSISHSSADLLHQAEVVVDTVVAVLPITKIRRERKCERLVAPACTQTENVLYVKAQGDSELLLQDIQQQRSAEIVEVLDAVRHVVVMVG